MNKHKVVQWLAVGAIVFGALSIFSGGKALFGSPQEQAAVGNAVPFVLWFNFCGGFFYILVAAGLLWHKHWAIYASILIAGLTAIVAAAFAVHIMNGGAFEMRTVGAMAIRFVFWLAIAITAVTAKSSR